MTWERLKFWLDMLNVSYCKAMTIDFCMETLPKAQRTRGLSSAYQSNFLSQVLTQILIRHLQNLDQEPTSKSWPNLETLCSKYEQKLNFMTKLHLPNLHQTVVSTFLIIKMSNSNNLNKFWVVIFTSIKFTKQQLVSDSVSDKHSQWSDSGPIKKWKWWKIQWWQSWGGAGWMKFQFSLWIS